MGKITLLVLVVIISNVLYLKLAETKAINNEDPQMMLPNIHQKDEKVFSVSDKQMFHCRLEKIVVQWLGEVQNKLRQYIDYLETFKGDIKGTNDLYE